MALIAQSFLEPDVRKQVDAMLALSVRPGTRLTWFPDSISGRPGCALARYAGHSAQHRGK